MAGPRPEDKRARQALQVIREIAKSFYPADSIALNAQHAYALGAILTWADVGLRQLPHEVMAEQRIIRDHN